MPAAYLLGRYSDKALGVFTGALAYHLHENNPRSRPLVGHSLLELTNWHWQKSKTTRRDREEQLMRLEERDVIGREEVERLRRELEGLGGALGGEGEGVKA